MSPYSFHPEAENDLVGVWEDLAGRNMERADRLIAEIERVLEILAAFPHQGHRRTDLTSRPLRFTVCSGLLDRLFAPTEPDLGSRGYPRTS